MAPQPKTISEVNRMRNNKNNITLSYRNIISFLNNLISHLTDNKKIITLFSRNLILCFIILTLSLLNTILNNPTFALDYQSPLNINFTINPSLSLFISSSDLVIDNLTPGTTADSNDITISVVTNASYGYTLSATTSNNNLVRSDNVDSVFSSIANNANLSSLDEDENNNIWGYSTSLDNGSTWSNYNGLSSSSSTTLLDKDNNTSSNMNFRIAAKAESTQPSGIYTNTITFYATTKPTPMNLAESYFANGKSRHKGYYTMQDMNSTICEETEVIGEESQTQLIDIRDDKVYWATKLADGHCWMTQNLDLDIGGANTSTLTSKNTDISTDPSVYINGSIYETGYSINNNIYTWNPIDSAITSGRAITYPNPDNSNNPSVSNWGSGSNTAPYSAEGGDLCYYTSNNDVNDIRYASFSQCVEANHTENGCRHHSVGNYYNWTAAVASNNSANMNSTNSRAINSICPKSWRLPNDSTTDDEYNEFGRLLYAGYNIISRISGGSEKIGYQENGFRKIRSNPLYFTRAGFIWYSGLRGSSLTGSYQSNTVYNGSWSYSLDFSNDGVSLANLPYDRNSGRSVRCLAR